MGVTIMQGDIFTTQAQVIGHGVNTQGLMGNGVARTIRIMYPICVQGVPAGVRRRHPVRSSVGLGFAEILCTLRASP